MRFRLRTIMVVLFLVALALTGGVGSAPAAPGDRATRPVRGGVFRLGLPVSPESLDPGAPGSAYYSRLVANSLISIGLDNKPRPELAESWEWNSDRTTITFRLRRGVRFHNGREMTADDVAFSFRRIRDDARVVNLMKGFTQKITDVRIVDPSTVAFTFPQALANAIEVFEWTFVVAREANVETGVVATGPFKVVDFVPGTSLRLVRHSDYWESGKPLLEEIVLQVISDPESLGPNIEAGAFDMIYLVPVPAFDRLAKDKRFAAVRTEPGYRIFTVMMNASQKPFDDRRVRQAVAHAIDRRRITERIVGSGVDVYCLPYPKSSAVYFPEQTEGCTYDPQRAKDLLTRAGYPDGFETVINTSRQLDPRLPVVAELLQAYLNGIGIRAKIQHFEQAAYVANLRGGRYQIVAHVYQQANKDPSTLYLGEINWRPDGNNARFRSPEYERLVNESATTLDDAKRRKVFRQLNLLVLSESFIIPIGELPRLVVYRSQMRDVKFNREGRLILTDAWMAR